jgi:hypothetical protein
MDARMSKLADQIKEAQGDAKARLQQEWDELEPQRRRARERLDELKKSSGEAWKDLKAGAQAAFDDLRKSVNQAGERFDNDSKE